MSVNTGDYAQVHEEQHDVFLREETLAERVGGEELRHAIDADEMLHGHEADEAASLRQEVWESVHTQSVGECALLRLNATSYESESELLADEDLLVARPLQEKPQHLLNQFYATAISGNDITSSVLYVVGLCTAVAGPFAPISILMVVVLLYLFRFVYSEVVMALPLNGGAYNALLNTTSKLVSAVGGTLTVLSYVATAVVSAKSAIDYLKSLVDGPDELFFWLPIAVLFVFCLLNLAGITESAVVASIIFTVHLLTLTILMVASFIYLIQTGFPRLVSNWSATKIATFGNPGQCIFYGFSAALLGVSGFESSANYVEEQAPGVFPKTLRNMWIAVAIFNPIFALLGTSMLDVDIIRHDSATNGPPLLSVMAATAVEGKWLKILVGVDASLVLSGAVLTSFVGVVGLMRRMALDRVLPAFFLKVNRCRRTPHWIILLFFVTTSCLYLIVGGDISKLAGVYALSFLCVMALFAAACMLLKYKRSSLPRPIRSSWPGVIIAFIGVIVGLVFQIVPHVEVLATFAIFFVVFLSISMAMFQRVRIFRLLSFALTCCGPNLRRKMLKTIRKINDRPVLFFSKHGYLRVLNKAITYIRDNELTDNIVIVHFYEEQQETEELQQSMDRMRTNVRILDRCYPKNSVSLLLVAAPFTSRSVEEICFRLEVPRNFAFMTTPSEKLQVKVADLGGVRLITH